MVAHDGVVAALMSGKDQKSDYEILISISTAVIISIHSNNTNDTPIRQTRWKTKGETEMLLGATGLQVVRLRHLHSVGSSSHRGAEFGG